MPAHKNSLRGGTLGTRCHRRAASLLCSREGLETVSKHPNAGSTPGAELPRGASPEGDNWQSHTKRLRVTWESQTAGRP